MVDPPEQSVLGYTFIFQAVVLCGNLPAQRYPLVLIHIEQFVLASLTYAIVFAADNEADAGNGCRLFQFQSSSAQRICRMEKCNGVTIEHRFRTGIEKL